MLTFNVLSKRQDFISFILWQCLNQCLNLFSDRHFPTSKKPDLQPIELLRLITWHLR